MHFELNQHPRPATIPATIENCLLLKLSDFNNVYMLIVTIAVSAILICVVLENPIIEGNANNTIAASKPPGLPKVKLPNLYIE